MESQNGNRRTVGKCRSHLEERWSKVALTKWAKEWIASGRCDMDLGDKIDKSQRVVGYVGKHRREEGRYKNKEGLSHFQGIYFWVDEIIKF